MATAGIGNAFKSLTKTQRPKWANQNKQASGGIQPTAQTATVQAASGSGRNVMTSRKPVGYDSASGGYSIRDSFKNSGLDDSYLTWDGRNVSYKGQSITPIAAVNGSTYASQADINDFISRAYQADGKKLVQANKTGNKYGVNALDWNSATGQVTVGGQVVPYAYADENGNAWVDEAELAAAYDRYAEENGLKAADDASNEYNRRLEAYDKMRDEILGEKWEYTPEELERDAAWQAYKKMYTREAGRAFNDSLAQTAALNGGGMSAAAQMAAGQNYNYQMQQLTDKIPELANLSYNRWAADRADMINAIQNKETAAYNRYLADESAATTAYDRNEALRKSALERMYEPINREKAELELEDKKRELEDKKREQVQTQINNDFKNALARGFYTEEEAFRLGISKDENGNLPSPYAPEAIYKLYLWENYGKMETDYKNEHELNILGINNAHDMDVLGVTNSAELEQLYAKYRIEKQMQDTENRFQRQMQDTENSFTTARDATLHEYDMEVLDKEKLFFGTEEDTPDSGK